MPLNKGPINHAVLIFIALCAALAAAPDQMLTAEGVGQARRPAAPVSPTPSAGGPGSPAWRVIFLQPLVRFEDIGSGMSTPGPAAGDSEYASRVLTAARAAVNSKASIVETDRLDQKAAEACDRLATLASRLARGSVNEEALSALASLAGVDAHYAVLVQFVRVKSGPGRSWNPNTGAITSSMASTLVQAALVSGDGRVIWKGEQLVRNKALQPFSSAFVKTVDQLYRNFEIN